MVQKWHWEATDALHKHKQKTETVQKQARNTPGVWYRWGATRSPVQVGLSVQNQLLCVYVCVYICVCVCVYVWIRHRRRNEVPYSCTCLRRSTMYSCVLGSIILLYWCLVKSLDTQYVILYLARSTYWCEKSPTFYCWSKGKKRICTSFAQLASRQRCVCKP